MMMPGMTGLQVLDRLRRSHSPQDLPVIFVTAIDDPGQIVHSLNAGASDYVTKPIDFPVLLARIEVQLRRKAAEEALRRSRHQTRAILECALDGILIVDHRGLIVEANDAAEQLLGFQTGSGQGRSFFDAAGPAVRDGQQALQALLFESSESPLGRRIETEFRRADGARFPAELSMVRIPESEPPSYAAFLRDITKRKQDETHLRASQEDLEVRLQQRTSEILRVNQSLQQEVFERQQAEAGLLRSRDAALAAAASSSGFVEEMSQEIGSLLLAIMGLARWGGPTGLTEAQKGDWDTALHSAASLGLLLTDLQDSQKRDEVDLAELAHRVCRALGPHASGRGVNLRLEVDQSVPAQVVADAWLLRQILTAMLGHALDCTADGEAVLRIATAAVSGSPALNCTVRYRGTCLPRENQEARIASTPDEDNGACPVATARRLALSNHGSVWLANTSEAGGELHLQLPVAPVARAVGA